jgi:hypothetical protein
MAHDATVQILLTGAGMLPGKIRSKEIAEIIESVEDMIASMVVHDHPDMRKESIIIGLKTEMLKVAIKLYNYSANIPYVAEKVDC